MNKSDNRLEQLTFKKLFCADEGSSYVVCVATNNSLTFLCTTARPYIANDWSVVVTPAIRATNVCATIVTTFTESSTKLCVEI